VWLYSPESQFAPDTEGSTLASESPSGQLFARSCTAKGKLMRSEYWSRAWKKGGWIKRLSGLTYDQSQLSQSAITFAKQLAETLESCSAESLANLIPWPAKSSARTMIATFGRIFSTPSMDISRWRASLKTYQAPLIQGFSSASGETWKPEATRLRQEYSRRRKSARPIDANAFLSWPSPRVPYPKPETANWATPKAEDGYRLTMNVAQTNRDNPGLQAEATLWATPKTSDMNGIREDDGKRGVGLNTETANWPTPMAHDVSPRGSGQKLGQAIAGNRCLGRESMEHSYSLRVQDWVVWALSMMSGNFTEETLSELSDALKRSLATPSNGSESLANAPTLRRRLNPQFVAWLMGVPIGWTSCAPLGMELSPRPSHTRSLRSYLDTWEDAMRQQIFSIGEWA
jgi:hypothetical protein